MQDRIDTGLACLTAVAGYYKIPADLRQLERAYVLEAGAVDTVTLVRAAHDLGLRARAYEGVTRARLASMTYPAIIRMKTGGYLVITGLRDGHMYILDPHFSMQRPAEADKEKVLSLWTGEIILFTRRYELKEEARKFGIRWFLPVIGKYKRYLLTVLGLSFLLQLLGLATPLFTQVIIDKVLVHRSTDALDILVAGMILCALFTNWMQVLRSYLFTNITSKMDVVLSSHLFKTITALPIKYFSKWQVGDVVSRVGELENLRNFITGSSLTIVLDIVFATVYFCVMVAYSRLLTLVVLVILPLFVLLNLISRRSTSASSTTASSSVRRTARSSSRPSRASTPSKRRASSAASSSATRRSSRATCAPSSPSSTSRTSPAPSASSSSRSSASPSSGSARRASWSTRSPSASSSRSR